MSKRWLERITAFRSKNRTRSLIGLDLGSTVIKAVEITMTEDGPMVTAVGRRELHPGEELPAVLAAFFEEHNFTAKEVATAVSGRSVIVRHLTAPPIEDDEDLRAAMSFEAVKLLPFDHEEILSDCSRLQRTPAIEDEEENHSGPRIGVALAACRNTVVEEQFRNVSSTGLIPIAVDVEVFALANAFELCHGELAAAEIESSDDEENDAPVAPRTSAYDRVSDDDEDELDDPYSGDYDDPYGAAEDAPKIDPFTGDGLVEASKAPNISSTVAIADIGASRTQISVIVGGETCFTREIAVGGADMTQAIARRLGIDNDEAEQLKRMPEGREEEVTEALESVLDDLVGDVSMSLDFVENHESVTVPRLLVTGGGSRTPGLIDALIRGTGREAARWQPFEKLSIDFERVDADELPVLGQEMAVAIGLAARVTAA
jgi:Tfp pilus assembly PilM family ATPase